jgi:hypothetical protein
MNYVGKILAFLNLVFALAVGGFLVVDFATRTNWHNEYVRLQNEMKVASNSVQTWGTTSANLATSIKKVEQERDTARQEVVDAQTLLKAQEAQYKVKLDEAQQQARDAQLTAEKALAEKERRTKENEFQLALIKQRDETIIALTADVRKYREFGLSQEAAHKGAQDRLEQALSRNAELEKALAKGTGVAGGNGDVKALRGLANPPSVYVEGKIDKIEPTDPSLVQISVGSDKGLAKNHTLEVYRVSPPLYLGQLRIVDVTAHEAIGRLERTGTGSRSPLRVGDTVASSISRN